MVASVRKLRESDIADALTLCRGAGWNQLAEDWRRFIRLEPAGCFVATAEDAIVGTVTSLSYGTSLGWIGMMLVDPRCRRQGIATALMRKSIEYLQTQQVQCIKLDATPAGMAVYQKLGFLPEWTFHRWQRTAPKSPSAESLPTLQQEIAAPLLEVDHVAFGVDRSELLRMAMASSQCHAYEDGFGMLRAGYLADYLGPVTATTPQAATRIIERLLRAATGTVFWDIPSPNAEAPRLARQLGFEPVRDLTRMWLGQPFDEPRLAYQYALLDPGAG